jgi:hypothetical protein
MICTKMTVNYKLYFTTIRRLPQRIGREHTSPPSAIPRASYRAATVRPPQLTQKSVNKETLVLPITLIQSHILSTAVCLLMAC